MQQYLTGQAGPDQDWRDSVALYVEQLEFLLDADDAILKSTVIKVLADFHLLFKSTTFKV